MTERRDTPTVRPGSGSVRAQSAAELGATVRIRLSKLGIMLDDAERRWVGSEEAVEYVPTGLLVDAAFLVDTFAAWDAGRAPGGEVQASVIRRYLAWLAQVDTLIVAKRVKD